MQRHDIDEMAFAIHNRLQSSADFAEVDAMSVLRSQGDALMAVSEAAAKSSVAFGGDVAVDDLAAVIAVALDMWATLNRSGSTHKRISDAVGALMASP